MAIMEPVRREDAPELESYFEVWDERMGYLPNCLMTMARKPEMVKALAALSKAVHNDCTISPELRGMVGQVSSQVHGCRYCMAHTVANSKRYGVPEDKIWKTWDYEIDDAFTEAERVALRFAAAASRSPTEVDKPLLQALKSHYSDTEIIEIMGVISYYGWWNRWNAALETTLEEMPREYAAKNFDATQWDIGSH